MQLESTTAALPALAPFHHTVRDNTKEADETFRVTITPLKNRKAFWYDATCGRCTATITIKDDD